MSKSLRRLALNTGRTGPVRWIGRLFVATIFGASMKYWTALHNNGSMNRSVETQKTIRTVLLFMALSSGLFL